VDTIGTHTAVLDIAFIKHVEGASGGHPPGTAAGLAADDTAGYKDTRDSRDEEGQHLSSYRESLPEARNHGQNASRVSRPLIRQPCQAAADDLRGVLRCCGPARCGAGWRSRDVVDEQVGCWIRQHRAGPPADLGGS